MHCEGRLGAPDPFCGMGCGLLGGCVRIQSPCGRPRAAKELQRGQSTAEYVLVTVVAVILAAVVVAFARETLAYCVRLWAATAGMDTD